MEHFKREQIYSIKMNIRASFSHLLLYETKGLANYRICDFLMRKCLGIFMNFLVHKINRHNTTVKDITGY